MIKLKVESEGGKKVLSKRFLNLNDELLVSIDDITSIKTVNYEKNDLQQYALVLTYNDEANTKKSYTMLFMDKLSYRNYVYKVILEFIVDESSSYDERRIVTIYDLFHKQTEDDIPDFDPETSFDPTTKLPNIAPHGEKVEDKKNKNKSKRKKTK